MHIADASVVGPFDGAAHRTRHRSPPKPTTPLVCNRIPPSYTSPVNDDYASIFDTLELDDRTLDIGHGETITPTLVRERHPVDPLQTLPRFTLETSAAPTDTADFKIVGMLGEGGMGLVSLAEQNALRRLVAVKEPKSDDVRAHLRVLEEAFVMGRVEHPNVVPAYTLGRREDGHPMLVMKRVEGTAWEDVLHGKRDAPGGVEADLSWHLRVLLQVCNALRFAHARRVVHRDIKPENVMVGEFGEVYLLDWGIALSLDPDADDGLPSAANARGLAGTPAFMAPEMTADDASEIDESTDVYLLGANLHTILTGEPPHSGKSLFEVLASAFNSAPREYEASVPPELGAIARRAMSKEKQARFPSVAAFADAVTDYLEHRPSYALADAAAKMLETTDDAANDPEAARRLQEAEFAFRQALTIWDGNERAQIGLQEAVERRVRSCIERRELGGARAALEQLPQPNPQLSDLVEALASELDAMAERVDYLERFERELGLRTATRSRQRAVAILGACFTVLVFLQAWSARPGQPEAPLEAWLHTYWRLLVIAGVGIALFWRKLFGNIANRRLIAFFLSALAGMLLLRIGAVQLRPPAMYLQVAEIAVIGMACFAVAAATSRRLMAVAGIAYSTAFVVGIVTAELWMTLTALASAHLIFFAMLVWVWRPSQTRTTEV